MKLVLRKKMDWFLYILKCSDLSLYTGITNRLSDRIKAHNSGKGARYTRGRLPVKLVYLEEFHNRSEASKREYAVKKMSKRKKMEMIEKCGT